ncbi:hypothetical protein [Marinigracilibium pacificum]|uniref:Lipoprotein n=1 Tax=Marinigracilibium pacificum TaxID=2729599 RepID=A0A848J365_9BACT|nr:hypothetical protein [Marinigracilibium pacificum]NMM47622.1 hypothetical protein [Marinigracilibium pacificum]
MKVINLIILFSIISVACSTEHKTPVLEQEYLNNEKENYLMVNRIKIEIENAGNRPKDLIVSERLDSMYAFKYTLPFKTEKEEIFPENVTDDHINEYKNKLFEIFKATIPNSNENKKWTALTSELKKSENYYDYVSNLLLISRLENQIISNSMRLIGGYDCFYYFGFHVGFNPIKIGQDNTIILTITDDYYIRTTDCTYKELKIVNLKNNEEQKFEAEMIGNIMQIKFTPITSGTYEISGMMDVKDKSSGHIMNFDFSKELITNDK